LVSHLRGDGLGPEVVEIVDTCSSRRPAVASDDVIQRQQELIGDCLALIIVV
jgi:hypothetical protein